MKKYNAMLSMRNDNRISPNFYENIEADNIIELLNKFYLASIRLIKQEHEEELNEIRSKDDDIPF